MEGEERTIPGADDDRARLEAALEEVPRGAVAISGVAVLLLMIGWFFVYILIFLPRGSVRLILVAGSVAVALVLYQRGQLTTPRENPGVVTLLLVGGFLLGVVLNAASDALRERGHRPPRLAEDLRALIAVAASVVVL